MEIFLNDLFAQTIIRSIGVSLLFSLIPGVLLGITAALVLLFTPKTSARVRYNLLIALLCVFVVSVAAIFYNHVSMAVAQPGVIKESVNYFYKANSDSLANVKVDLANWNSIWFFLVKNAQAITLIWFIIVLFKMIRMAKGIYDLHVLKNYKIYSVGKYWEDKTADLAIKIGLTRQLKVVQSGLAKVPMVMGHLKPVILIPLGVIARIPAEQIEMILLHELAHIRRLDFFVNLLQHLAELLFFFNPAVLWVSFLIRKERENCCDDIAVQFSGSKKTYINALLSFREYQVNDSVYTMAFTKESSLLERAKRIAFQKNVTLKLSERIFLVVTLALLFTFSLLIAQVSQKRSSEKIVQKSVQPNKVEDTGAKKLSTNRIHYLDQSEGDVVSRNTIKNLRLQTQQLEGNEPGLVPNGLSNLTEKSLKVESLPSVSDTLRRLKMNDPIKLGSLQYERPHLQSLDSLHGPELVRELSPLYVSKQSLLKMQDYPARRPYQPVPLKLRKTFNTELLDEIEKAGVKYDRNDVLVHITNYALFVDGVKQSEEVHKKVLSRFVRKPGDKVDFTFDNGL